jgi:peptide/nickel transport system ATP-binding protein/oligopeptide transport system ATP-binding protein
VQAQILDLLLRLQREFGMAIILITHDLGVVAEFAQRVLVMYAGNIVEQGPVDAIFTAPCQPYTRGLLDSISPINRDVFLLPTIEGTVPFPTALPPGCRFQPRCGWRFPAVQHRCRNSSRSAPPSSRAAFGPCRDRAAAGSREFEKTVSRGARRRSRR